MGVDISWQAFDDEEVERMWNEYPLGELISLLEDDKLFWQRRKDFVPEETLRGRKKRKWEVIELLPHLQEIAKVADNNENLQWNVENRLADYFSQSDLLELDYQLISYFTYLEVGNRFSVYSEATMAVYEAQGLEFHEDDLIYASMTPQWLSIVRETDKEILINWMAKHHLNNPVVQFPTITDMKEIRENAEYTIKDIHEIVGFFDYANKNNLSVFAMVGEMGHECGYGTGKYNLVNRFEKRFVQTKFPPQWKEYMPYQWWSTELQETPDSMPLLPRSSRWYNLYIMEGGERFNLQGLVKTILLRKTLDSIPQVKGDGKSYTIPPYHVDISISKARKGPGVVLSLELHFGDPVPRYDHAVHTGIRISQKTNLKLFDSQLRSYITESNASDLRKKFLDYARKVRAGEDVPFPQVPRWRGKKWHMFT